MKTQTAQGIKRRIRRIAPDRTIPGAVLSARRHQAGLSFNELMIVILVAAVLAMLAIFSTSSLILSTKYSRVQEDHRVLTRALENYMMDYSTLPETTSGLGALERPTAYVGAVPADPFQPNANSDYLYLRPNLPGIAFILISTGPDGDYDLPNVLRPYAGLAMDDFGTVPPETLRVAGLSPQTNPQDSPALSRSEADFWSSMGLEGPPRSREADQQQNLQAPSHTTATRQDFERSILEYYLQNKSWSPDSPTTDGDIITIVRY